MDSQAATAAAGPVPVLPGAADARQGALLVFGAAMAWSFGGAIARGLEATDPWTIIAWRGFFATLLLMGFMLWRDGPGGTVRLFRPIVPYMIIHIALDGFVKNISVYELCISALFYFSSDKIV